jgi:hypothetical protein
VRLRNANQRLTDRILPILDDPDDTPGARPLHALPRTLTVPRTTLGWTEGMPVQVAGSGAAIWRVDPDSHQDPDSGRVVVTCGDATLRVDPSVLTYVATAPLHAGEQVYRVGAGGLYGVVTRVEPGPLAANHSGDAEHLFVVRWFHDPDREDGPNPRHALQRPADLALAWGLATAVADATGRTGHIAAVSGGAVAVRWDTSTWPPVITWHPIPTLYKVAS